jgi:hypothetical protein
MIVELDGKEFKVLDIALETIEGELIATKQGELVRGKEAQNKYVTAIVILQNNSLPEPITLFSKSVFTKNATIEDIIKDTWEDNQ